jgi:hypothetical protein
MLPGVEFSNRVCIKRQVSKRQKRELRRRLLLSGTQQKHMPRGGHCPSKATMDKGEFNHIEENHLTMRVNGIVCA